MARLKPKATQAQLSYFMVSTGFEFLNSRCTLWSVRGSRVLTSRCTLWSVRGSGGVLHGQYGVQGVLTAHMVSTGFRRRTSLAIMGSDADSYLTHATSASRPLLSLLLPGHDGCDADYTLTLAHSAPAPFCCPQAMRDADTDCV